MFSSLAIDIGNTRIHWAAFERRELVKSKSFDLGFFEFPEAEDYIYSSVSEIPENLQAFLSKRGALKFDHQTPVPVKITYSSPESLGMDRLAAAVAAQSRFPKSNVLSIDMGTCITYDLIDSEGNYHGGAISPGVNMRIKAMNQFTAKLPKVNAEFPPQILGANTQQSLQSGVMNGIRNEMDGMIADFQLQFEDLQVILTGGDLHLFEEVLKNHIFADPNLVLRGLNEILLYNRA